MNYIVLLQMLPPLKDMLHLSETNYLFSELHSFFCRFQQELLKVCVNSVMYFISYALKPKGRGVC